MQLPWKKCEIKRKMNPAKIGLLAFMGVCLGLLVWDMSVNGYSGGLTLDQPAVSVGEDLVQPMDMAPQQVAGAEATEVAAAYFAGYRMDREQARGDELALLQKIIDDPGGSPAIREEAEQRRLHIAAAVEAEAQAESLLHAKGFGESVVLLGADQATAIVSLEIDAITAAQIAEIVSSACDINYENVIIVNR